MLEPHILSPRKEKKLMAISGILFRRKEWSTVAKRRIVPPKFTVRLGGIWTKNSNGRTTEISASLAHLSD